MSDGATGPESFEQALVVDGDAHTATRICAALRSIGVLSVAAATSVGQALSMLDGTIDLVLCDMCIDERDGFSRVVTRAGAQPRAVTIVAMTDDAPRRAVHELARAGVAGFLEKPFDSLELRDCLARACAQLGGREGLERIARANVGHASVREALRCVRDAMFREALARTRGNRHAAARLLQVDRRLVQLRAADLDGE